MDDKATVKKEGGGRTTECLTDKQRALRGLRYFCAVLTMGFALCAMCMGSEKDPSVLSHLPHFGMFSLPPALATGLGVMAFRQRRCWQWAIMAFFAAASMVVTVLAIVIIFAPKD